MCFCLLNALLLYKNLTASPDASPIDRSSGLPIDANALASPTLIIDGRWSSKHSFLMLHIIFNSLCKSIDSKSKRAEINMTIPHYPPVPSVL
ncbi:hypothetical protein HDV63DRAFT_238796 [Trichoderma sp. SZMC 28014]